MRSKERRDRGQSDLFRARLDQIVDLGHPLVRLATTKIGLANLVYNIKRLVFLNRLAYA